MVAARVEGPWLKGIVFRYLLAHAEDPSRAKGSGIPAVEIFSHKAPFYNKFIKKVMDEVPGYDERKLLDTGADVPQEDFKAILRCFKELSGVWNPFHYSVFGRVIPAVQDKVTKMAAAVGVTALGPSIVISSSPRYNDDFNSDQEIVIESKPKTRRGITTATIQHYLLPSVSEPYVEMITAGIGYYDGIPKLFKWRSTGKTKILDLPFTLEELIDGDLAYANLNLEYNKDGTVLINDQNKGRKEGLQKLLEEEPIVYKEEFLARELSSFELDETSGYDGRPVIIDTDFEVDGEVLIPAGRYGMPCARYVVNVPKPNFLRRFFWAGLSLFSRDKDEYLFLGRTNEAVEASDEANRAQLQIERTHNAEKSTLEARADLAELRRDFDTRMHSFSEAFGDGWDIAHTIKNFADGLRSRVVSKLQYACENEDYTLPDTTLLEPKVTNDQIRDGLEKILNDPMAPKKMFPFVRDLLLDLRSIQGTRDNAEILMGTKMPLDKEEIGYIQFIEDAIAEVQSVHPGYTISFQRPDTDYTLNIDRRVLGQAMLNIMHNAIEASPEGILEISQSEVRIRKGEGIQAYSITRITQAGYLDDDIAEKLNAGEKFTTKLNGHGIGAQASRNAIHRNGGSIEYIPLYDDGGEIEISLIQNRNDS
jgi:signal transduction histidine kinase